MTLREFQEHIRDVYGARDTSRGCGGTFLWLVEEVGELAEAIRLGDETRTEEELADVMAWLVSVANLEGVDVEKAVTSKYGGGCSCCGETPCRCQDPSRRLG
jgi:NTP pyrophosphatase (non-canonical NTP hydrolase)